MRIKFLQTCPSETPDFPFHAGQVVEVTMPTPAMRTALRDGFAEILHDELEAAVVGTRSEQAVLKRARGRK